MIIINSLDIFKHFKNQILHNCIIEEKGGWACLVYHPVELYILYYSNYHNNILYNCVKLVTQQKMHTSELDLFVMVLSPTLFNDHKAWPLLDQSWFLFDKYILINN